MSFVLLQDHSDCILKGKFDMKNNMSWTQIITQCIEENLLLYPQHFSFEEYRDVLRRMIDDARNGKYDIHDSIISSVRKCKSLNTIILKKKRPLRKRIFDFYQ